MSAEEENKSFQPNKESLAEFSEGIQESRHLELSLSTKYLYTVEKQVFNDQIATGQLDADDRLVILLYQILYSSRFHNNPETQPKFKERIKTFKTYQKFFQVFLEEMSSIHIDMSFKFIWKIINGFVREYELFCHYRENLKDKTEDEFKYLRRNEKLWDPPYVLETLYKLVEAAETEIKYHIREECHRLCIKFGYFAIYGLQQVYLLQSDYYNAVKILLKKSNFPQSLIACASPDRIFSLFSILYYTACAYFMKQNYFYAMMLSLKTLQFFMQNIKTTYDNLNILEFVVKLFDIVSHCFIFLDTTDSKIISLMEDLKGHFEKGEFANQIGGLKLQMNLPNSFYILCCIPQFVLLKAPNLDGLREDYSTTAAEHQLKIFRQELENRKIILDFKVHLKVNLEKGHGKISVVNFMKSFIAKKYVPSGVIIDKEDYKNKGISYLLRIKYKESKALLVEHSFAEDCTKNGISYAKIKRTNEIDFFIDGELIHLFIISNCK